MMLHKSKIITCHQRVIEVLERHTVAAKRQDGVGAGIRHRDVGEAVDAQTDGHGVDAVLEIGDPVAFSG